MKTHYDCVPCMIKSILNLFRQGLIEEQYQEKVLKEVLKYYSELDFGQSPLLVNRNLHRLVREFSNNPDPYKSLKEKYNNKALEYYKCFKNQDLTKEKALKIALAGNIIDFGPGHKVDIDASIEKVFNSNIKINHSEELLKEITSAKKVLYLGDNTGEIVFDKLFIEMLNHPGLVYAVRKSPILNDSTYSDAEFVGITSITEVIVNGDDSPGTLLTSVSEAFMSLFNSADLIISKGQGNYEGLSQVRDKNIYFMLAAKCQIIADDLGVNVGDFVVKSQLHSSKTQSAIRS